MNREIKFRCWIKPYYKFDKCKKDYRMIYPHLEKDNWYVIDCQSQTLMDGEGGKISDYKMYIQQFTGLKDKNGKEIYEGDILGGLYDGGYISWCEKCKQFQYFGCKDECFACGGDVHWFELLVEEELEVIGNIFENPELINK